MATLRNLNVLDQMRLDVPYLRLIESGVRGDFDAIVGQATAGGQPLVVRGLTIAGSGRAETLELVVADAIAYNYNATDSGSFLHIPSDEPNQVLDGTVNRKVTGAFVSGSPNYVGLDFVRETDPDSTGPVTFVDPIAGIRTQSVVETAEHLTYRIVIGTTPFSALSNIVPIAKIDVFGGVVSSVTDARPMMFRLGSGGDFPSNFNSYAWPQDRSTSTDFTGGDKAISSQKDWSDAIMTRIWELGGGASWYTNTADRNVWSINTEAPFANGDYWTFNSGTGATEFKNVKFFFTGAGAGVYYNTVPGNTGSPVTLLDGQCVYVDLDRTSNAALTAYVGDIATVGTGNIPGARWILAWRNGSQLYTRNWRFPVGVTYTPATNLALGVVRLNAVAPVTNDPVVPVLNAGGGIAVAATSGNTAGGAFQGSGIYAGVVGLSGNTPNALLAGVWGNGLADTGAIGVRGQGAASTGATAGGVGVTGVGGTSSGAGAGGAGGRFTGGAGSTDGAGVVGVGGGGSGVGVSGTSSGGDGVFGQSATGWGVHGVGGTNQAGMYGEGNGTGAGVEGASQGNGAGVHGIGFNDTDGSPGVEGSGGDGTDSGAPGVKGQGGTSGGDFGGFGVYGQGGTGSLGGGSGVYGVGGTNGIGVEGRSTGTGHAVVGTATGGASGGSGGRFTTTTPGQAACRANSADGLDFGAENGGFGYQSTKTGSLIVDATEFIAVTGAAKIAPNATTDAATNWKATRIAFTNGDRFLARVKLPRGAAITGVAVLMKKDNWVSSLTESALSNPKITHFASTATGTTETLVHPGGVGPALTVTFNPTPGTGWGTVSGIVYSPMGLGNSADNGWVVLDWTLSGAVDTANLRIGAIRIDYGYQRVDFMV